MNIEPWRHDWVVDKCQVAARLFRGEAGGSYAEAAILVCATLSALAAELWVGTGIDRVRFIEMLVSLGPQANTCKTISVPLLIQRLEESSKDQDAERLRKAFSVSKKSYILTGAEVDRSESEVLTVCPELSVKELRDFSYASLLYHEIRSSYAHEYRPGKQADSMPMIEFPDPKVSYINPSEEDGRMRRLIHFHFEWLLALSVELASAVDSLAPALPQKKPPNWWANG